MVWCLTVTSVLIVDSISSVSVREQAVLEDRVLALSRERNQRAMEARAAQQRFAAAIEQISSMQSELLALESRNREMESEFQVARDTLRRTMEETGVALSASTASQDQKADELAGTLDLLTRTLAETVDKRDQAAAKTNQALRLAGELELELRLREEESDRILRQIEDTLFVSVEPLDEMLRATGLDSEALLASVKGGQSFRNRPVATAAIGP